MMINGASTVGLGNPAASGIAPRSAPHEAPFASVLTDLVQQTQNRQASVVTELERVVTGEATGVHDLVASVAQADLAFRLALEVRDRLIASYHEIMRMQV